MAWQYDRPDAGEGMVQAFRRPDNSDTTKHFRLSGLDPAAQYEITNFDVEGSTKASGQDLMENGLTVEIKDQPWRGSDHVPALRSGRPLPSLTRAAKENVPVPISLLSPFPIRVSRPVPMASGQIPATRRAWRFSRPTASSDATRPDHWVNRRQLFPVGIDPKLA